MIGDLFQAEGFNQIGRVDKERFEPAVIEVEEGLENKAGEELGLGKSSGAEATGKVGQRVLACRQGHDDHLPW